MDRPGHLVTDLAGVTVTATRGVAGAGGTVDPVEQCAAQVRQLYLGDGYYRYNWQLPGSYAGSAYTMTLDLGGAAIHQALFEFTGYPACPATRGPGLPRPRRPRPSAHGPSVSAGTASVENAAIAPNRLRGWMGPNRRREGDTPAWP